MRRALVTVAACMISLGSAAAQEVYVEEFDDYDDDAYVEAPAIVDEPAVVEEGPAADAIEGGSHVYGWREFRPANCGTFKYWNGDACVDARFDPPPEE